MTKNKTAPRVGGLDSGPLDAITDVPGVRVGHHTLQHQDQQTGVTVIVPPVANPFLHKIPAGLAVINGFGKSVGLVQVEELGQLETPIALTNTFSVSDVAKAQIRQAIAQNTEIGRNAPTVNPLVLECNDGYLNDIQAMAITEAHYRSAVEQADTSFAQGSVGAGRGMSCFGLKGGIGSASRVAQTTEQCSYTVGALVLANFGRPHQFILNGQRLGKHIEPWVQSSTGEIPALSPEKGSIIMILATDAPVDARQLSRLARRSAAGLARTGSVYGHGSGDIALAFSTAYTQSAEATEPDQAPALLHETQLDALFEAVAEATEQAIIHAMWYASTVTGRNGHQRLALSELPLDWDSLTKA